MHKINIREMRASLGNLDNLVNEAGELIVTRRGKEIVRILPIRRQRKRPSHAALRNLTARLAQGSEALVREERNER